MRDGGGGRWCGDGKQSRGIWQLAKDEVKCSRFSSLIKQSNMRLLEALGMQRKKVTDG